MECKQANAVAQSIISKTKYAITELKGATPDEEKNDRHNEGEREQPITK